MARSLIVGEHKNVDEGKQQQLEILINEWVQLREDSRSFWSSTFTGGTLGTGLVGALAILLPRDAPSWAWVGLLVAVLAVAAMVVQQMQIHTVRAHYERKIEEKLMAAADLTVQLGDSVDARVPVPGVAHYVTPLFDWSSLKPRTWYYAFPFLSALAMPLLLGIGVGLVAFSRMDGFARWPIVIVYLIMLLLLAAATPLSDKTAASIASAAEFPSLSNTPPET